MRKRLDILDRKEDILEWINNQESKNYQLTLIYLTQEREEDSQKME